MAFSVSWMRPRDILCLLPLSDARRHDEDAFPLAEMLADLHGADDAVEKSRRSRRDLWEPAAEQDKQRPQIPLRSAFVWSVFGRALRGDFEADESRGTKGRKCHLDVCGGATGSDVHDAGTCLRNHDGGPLGEVGAVFDELGGGWGLG